ncbi:4-(cytidine 5'-diphospho)-2-C-methyl-D-erythritol kinase [Roseofilum sp. Belize Diploria]|uniref:4-(cytidine 5'-diphospho)-2-C-methyl-D-erythritol kinase n=1 Tax=Roseofilum sp. Belize Diploria TaxID=2821501 RepID=UPI001B09CF4D|nr:4-(cytidine 5'-diphospho)-2-C-methyl-D-erythritol kinase [Roseofilum sp. Belize Diploria]MBP0008013.1 4-(cytidine 5'-diphospho)-2-C-methyl-D-erythritol kinase [Roseofilum sp. Belize Diploria]
MRSYTLLACAKINLYLEIVGDRADGYHELAMIMQSVGLCDRLHIEPSGTDTIRITCNHPDVPSDSSNLAYRAAELMCSAFPEAFAQYGGVNISIDKHIPVAAGLAGGSSNAAAVLVGMDLLWNLGLTQGECERLGEQLGSDVPFCVRGGTALATGRGEKLSPLPDLDRLYVVLAKYESVKISTAWAYKTYRNIYEESYIRDPEHIEAYGQKVHSGPIVRAIASKNHAIITEELRNDFEKIVLPEYPQLVALKQRFIEARALGTLMSGSGSTIFALTESQAEADRIKNDIEQQLNDPDLNLWVAQFSPTGIKVSDE